MGKAIIAKYVKNKYFNSMITINNGIKENN